MSAHNRDRGLPHGGFVPAQRPQPQPERTQPQKMHNSDGAFVKVVYVLTFIFGAGFLSQYIHIDIESSTMFVYILLAIIVYFAPFLIAAIRNHNNTGAILALNVLLGWTFLGWAGAIVWSFSDNAKKGGQWL